eukprot:4543449-Amphidinium_carterae.3
MQLTSLAGDHRALGAADVTAFGASCFNNAPDRNRASLSISASTFTPYSDGVLNLGHTNPHRVMRLQVAKHNPVP